jgi:hypothetical protein
MRLRGADCFLMGALSTYATGEAIAFLFKRPQIRTNFWLGSTFMRTCWRVTAFAVMSFSITPAAVFADDTRAA